MFIDMSGEWRNVDQNQKSEFNEFQCKADVTIIVVTVSLKIETN